MIFYSDEHMSQRVALRVRSFGHTVVTTDEMGKKSAGDEEQLFLARRHRRVLVTHNGNNFLLLHRALHLWASVTGLTDVHAGVLILNDRLTNGEKARLLDLFAAEGLPTDNRCYEWRDPGGWTRID